MSSRPPETSPPSPHPPAINYVVGFLMVGLAWGLTTPFIRRAAREHRPPAHPVLESEAVRSSRLRSRAYGAFFAVVDLLRNPRYAVPLLLNLTGSVWFFLLIGKAGGFLGSLFTPPPPSLCSFPVFLFFFLSLFVSRFLAPFQPCIMAAAGEKCRLLIPSPA